MQANSAINDAIAVLNRQGVIVHATEGVFGLGCVFDSAAACKRIAKLKGRDRSASPFLLLAESHDQIADLVNLDVPLHAEIKASWPGPMTWVFASKSKAYPWLGGVDGSLAVRLTAHPQVRELIRSTGPLISTSANRHGDPAALELERAKVIFGSEVDFYLPGTLQNPGQASRIRDARSGSWIRR